MDKAIYKQSRRALTHFVIAMTDDERQDAADEEEVIAELVEAAGNAVLGIWLELSRIADELEHFKEQSAARG